MQKKIVLFILMLLGSHILLILIGMNTGLRDWSQKFVIQQGKAWSQPYLKDVGEVRWQAYKAKKNQYQHNVQILFASQEMIAEMKKGGNANVNIKGHSFNSWTELLMPNLFLLALFIATPISIRRRVLAYLLALLVLNTFLVARLGLYVHYLYSIYVDAPHIFNTLLKHPASIVLRHAWLSIMVAFFAWLITSFRAADFNRFFELPISLNTNDVTT